MKQNKKKNKDIHFAYFKNKFLFSLEIKPNECIKQIFIFFNCIINKIGLKKKDRKNERNNFN